MIRGALSSLFGTISLVVGLALFTAELVGLGHPPRGQGPWLAGLLLMALGAVLLYFGIRSFRKARRTTDAPASAEFPEPGSHVAWSQQKATLWHWYVVPVIWGVITVIFNWAAFTKPGIPGWVIGMAILFALVFVLIIYGSWQHLRNWARFGPIGLHIEQHPLTPGQELKASLKVPNTGMMRPVFSVRLACKEVRYILSRDGEGNRTTQRTEEEVFSTDKEIRGRPSGGQTRIDFSIEVPLYQPPTDDPESLDHGATREYEVPYYCWFVHVEADLRGYRFVRDYPVLVRPAADAATAAPPTENPATDSREAKAVQTRVLAELERGKAPEEIWQQISELDFPEPTLVAGFSAVAATPGLAQAASLRAFLARRDQTATGDADQETELPDSGYWDPLSGQVKPEDADRRERLLREKMEQLTENSGRFSRQLFSWLGAGETVQDLRERLETFRADPGQLKRRLWMLLAIPATTTVLTVMFFDPVWHSLGRLADQGDARILLFLPFAIPYLYIRSVYSLQTDLVKLEVAEANDWLYAPSKNEKRGRLFNKKFSSLFTHRERQKPELEDEFWGRYTTQRQTVHFWSGLFHYKVESRVRVNKQRKVKKHTWTAVAMPLNAPLDTTFLIRAHPARWRWFRRLFHRRVDLNTASAEFNRLFDIYRNGIQDEDPLSIMKTLSPAVQVRLIDLYNHEGEFAFLFERKKIVFLFHGRLLKNMRTDFFTSVELDERDRTRVQDRLNHVLAISGDIIPFLD